MKTIVNELPLWPGREALSSVHLVTGNPQGLRKFTAISVDARIGRECGRGRFKNIYSEGIDVVRER